MQKKKRRRDRTASLKHERKYYELGYRYIFGIDEVGRGPWAGPVAAGAVCLPLARADLSHVLKGVRDSKEMTPLQRMRLAQIIQETALAWGIGSASAEEIDALGIDRATRRAMERALASAVERYPLQPYILFLDDVLLPEMNHIHQVSMVSGDKRSLSIASASVIAKVWRDAYMDDMANQFPAYGFHEHKGYGTAAHQAALMAYGPTPIHRRTYRPVQALGDKDTSP